MTENRGPWLCTAMALFLTWTVLMFAVRAWAKLRTKNWGLDDYVISTALLMACIQQGLFYRAVQVGYGRHGADVSAENLAQIETLLYAAQIFYIICLGMCRVAAALFVAHMSHGGPQTKSAHILSVLAALWTTASTFAIAIRQPYLRPWTVMDGTEALFKRWIGIESIGLVVEIALWVLSVNLIWGLQMRVQKRLFILGAFAVRLVLVPIIILRIIYLDPARNHDPTFTTIIPNVLTAVALQFSIMSSSVTSLKPFLRTFNPPTYSYHSAGTQASAPSNNRLAYYKLDTFKRVERGGTGGVSNDSANWRPYQGSVQGSASAQPPKPNARRKDDDARPIIEKPKTSKPHHHCPAGSRGGTDAELGVLDAYDRIIIQKTTELSIRYEEGPPK